VSRRYNVIGKKETTGREFGLNKATVGAYHRMFNEILKEEKICFDTIE
jgi:hypothetical protein